MHSGSRVRRLIVVAALLATMAIAGSSSAGVPQDQGRDTQCPEGLYLACEPGQSTVSVGDDIWIEIRYHGAFPDGLAFNLIYDPAALELMPTEHGALLPGTMHPLYELDSNWEISPGSIYYSSDLTGPFDAGYGLKDGYLVASLHVRGRVVGASDLTFANGWYNSEGPRPDCVVPVAGVKGSVVVTPPATATPTPTASPSARVLHGTVRDAWDNPVPDAQLTLFRDNNGVWEQKATGTIGGDGVFRLFTNAIPGEWKLVMQPPAGYTAQSAALPEGVTGEVVSADTLTFTLDDETGQIGPFAFTVEQGPTPEPTLPPVVLAGHVTLGGQPLAGVDVTLSPGGLSVVQTTTTDAEGYYAFTASPGVYTLSVHDPEGRIPDRSRIIDTDAWEPGPIDWETWLGWLPMVMVNK